MPRHEIWTHGECLHQFTVTVSTTDARKVANGNTHLSFPALFSYGAQRKSVA